VDRAGKGEPCRHILAILLAAALGLLLGAGPLPASDTELLVSPGKLSRVHAGLSGIRNCTLCHTEKKQVDPGKCLDCHKDLAARVRAGRGYHRDKGKACLPCHPEHLGENFSLIEWDIKKFSHAQTGFPLTGAHKKIGDCAACHAAPNALKRNMGKTYLLRGRACADCHADVHGGRLGADCARCHSADVPFKQATFDHGKTRFPLSGAHKNVACASCHTGNKRQGIAFSRCSSCHADPHRPTRGEDCRTCHGQDSWKTATFDHDRTRYPLRGKHAALACVQCHPRGKPAGRIPFADCSDCHRRDPHQGQFGMDCRSCHVVDGFEKAAFNHGNSRFPLTGKHAGVACAKCHPKAGPGQTAPKKPGSTACSDCHADVHLGQFGKKCESCHSPQGFTAAALKFDHQAGSAFPLQGKHASTSCRKCHVKKLMTYPAGKGEAVLYKPLSAECRACHADYHQGQLPADCRQCHGFDSFAPAPGFDHQRSRFSLKLFHEGVGCRACHPLVKLPSGGATAPTVQYKNIPTACRECHRDFDHSRTAFALTGPHSGLDCGRCHNARTPNVGKSGEKGISQTECTRCHRSPHLGLQKSCRECHSGKDWRVEPW
jgi:hypothetical protein